VQSIVKKQFVQVDGMPAADLVRPGARAAQRCKKSVRVLRLENVVRALEVTCSCGETTVVEIEYPSAKE
jgi:hypothetical protein